MHKSENNISRRDFLKTATAGAVSVMTIGVLSACSSQGEAPTSTGNPAQEQTASTPQAAPMVWDKEVDVLIVGGGGTGVAAAVEAAESGAVTLVIEKSSIMGGSTMMSGGMIHVAGTKYQEKFNGVADDSVEKLEQFYLLAGGDLVDPELVRDMALASPDHLAWCEECGIEYVNCFGVKPIPGVPEEFIRPRIHLPGDATSGTDGIAGIGYLHVNPIWARAQKAGATMMMDTEGKTLLTNDAGEVIGLIAQQDGKEISILAKRGVVLATSGYDHNVEMAKAMCLRQYSAITNAGDIVGSCAKNTGDGIRMGMAVGAGLAGIGGSINVSLNGCIGRDPTSNIGGPTTGITVNVHGQRFVNEWTQYGYYMKHCFAQDEGKAWTITDQNAVNTEGGLAMGFSTDDLSAEIASGAVVKAFSLEELAQALGINAAGLIGTVERWNADVASGTDTAFAKTEGLNAINTAPYYAAAVLDYNLGTTGGLKIDVNAQVLSFDNQPIARLFAGGLCTGGWVGTFYPGSGTAILGTVHWGRKAGKNAAAAAPWC